MTDTPAPSEMLLAWAADVVETADRVQVCTLGGADLPQRLAAVSGGDLAKRVTHFPAGRAPGRTFTAMIRLRRHLRQSGEVDVMHAWSLHAAAVAAWARPGTPILLTTDAVAVQRAERGLPPAWMRAALRRAGSLTWMAPVTPSRRWLARLKLARADGVRVPPPVNARRFDGASDRARQRLAWGIPELETRVVALVADRPEDVDALAATLGVGLAWETGRDFRLVLSPRAGHLQRAASVVAGFERSSRWIVDAAADRPWQIANAVDAVVLGDAAADSLSLAWAASAGLPVIAPRAAAMTAAEAEAANPLVEQIFARPDSPQPGRVAPHICRLYDDFAVAQPQATALRDTVRSLHAIAAHRAGLAGTYEALAAGQTPRWRSGAEVGSKAG